MDTQLARITNRSGLRAFSDEPIIISKVGHHLIEKRYATESSRKGDRASRVQHFFIGGCANTSHIGDEIFSAEIRSDDALVSEE